ncbi:hypothetical protein [Thalassobaculum sp.]|uniref:hypothetical protein n=1 Tax=Thalassobaculum sp. TaxID=2022740 RepID=UPI0032EB96FA
MGRKHTVTVPLSDADRARLAELAAARKESEEAVASETVHAYLCVQARHVAEIARALEEAEQPGAGFVPHEEVAAWVESLGVDRPLPVARRQADR